MRPFELYLTLLLLASAVRLAFSQRPRWTNYLPTATAIMTALHLLIEGYRWQMVPIYVLVVGLSIFALPRFQRTEGKSDTPLWQSITKFSVGMLLVALAVAVPILLPVPRVPAPPGPYQVGTFSMMLVDSSRHEIYSGNPDDLRKIMLQVWYPADPGPEDQAAPWMDRADIIGPAVSRYLDMPPFFLDHLIYSNIGAYLNSPAVTSLSTFPVLVFSHGWNGFRSQNTYQASELASYGYVVVGIEHTYGAIVTVFPDGQIAYNNPDTLPEGVSDEEYALAANKLINQWAGDIGFVLDLLTTMSADDSELGVIERLDLENVGLFGHSTGGGAVVEFCALDPRCKIGMGMDAFLTPVSTSVFETGLRQPFLYMFSDNWESHRADLFEDLYTRSDEATTFSILGTAHFDFSDLPMLSPIADKLGLKGPLDGERVIEIVDSYTLAFFNQYFFNQETTLIDGPSPDYPEVIFR